MTIRPYRESDKPHLRHICKETAWDSYKADPAKLECVPIVYNDYFTEQEPEYIFVLANDEDVPVGYIICSADYEKFVRLMQTEYRDRVLAVCPEEVGLIDFFLKALEAIQDRPVHFHIDLLPECQRQGWGRKLIATLCDKLAADGYTSLSVCCTNRQSDGYKMYTHLGFTEIFDYGWDTVSLNLPLPATLR